MHNMRSHKNLIKGNSSSKATHLSNSSTQPNKLILANNKVTVSAIPRCNFF